jgi:hypothetical protein
MPNYTAPLTELIDRVNGAQVDLCELLREVEPVKPLLAQVVSELETQGGITISGPVWHTMILAAAAGYAVGLTDAFEGMAELSAMTDSNMGES